MVGTKVSPREPRARARLGSGYVRSFEENRNPYASERTSAVVYWPRIRDVGAWPLDELKEV